MRHSRTAINCLLVVTALGLWCGVLFLYSHRIETSSHSVVSDAEMANTNQFASRSSGRLIARHSPRLSWNISEINLDFFSEAPPDYVSISDSRVGANILDLLGIDQSKRPAIQEIFECAWTEAEQGMKARLQFIESESDPTNGVFVYRIPADRVAGEAILKDLTSKLVGLLGEKDTIRFLAGVNPFANSAGFGMGEVQIRFAPSDGTSIYKGSVPMVVEYSVNNPVTHSRAFAGVGNPNGSFSESFGSIADDLLQK